MTDETTPAIEPTLADAPAASPTEIPQVGDILPGGVVAGVRICGGAVEISFNGVDWTSHF